MDQDRYRYFRIEARELHQQIGEGLLALEKGGVAFEQVPTLLRLAHTLKGAARVVKQREIADRAHALEEVLSPFRDETGTVPRDRVAQALELLDASDALLRAIDAPKSVPPGEKPQRRGEVFETVRTDIADVEALLDGLSEAHAQVMAIKKVLGSGERAKALLDVLVEQLTPRAGRDILSSPGAAQKARSIAEELRATLGKFERSLGVAVDQADRELGEVRDRTEQLRLVPCRTLFVGLERTARDGALTAGKAVDFEASGGDIRLDAHVLERIQPALVQLVRNAVAHGIEAGPERGAIGKRTTGKISLEVLRRGRNVVFRVSDDGRGIDVGAVRRALQSRGRFKELEQLDEGGLMAALLRGGISTSQSVTELAGRGIGLDVLRDAVETLKGTASVRTERGVGTTFELTIPPSAASIEMLSVEAGGELVNVPLESVCMAIRLTAEQITRTGQGSAVAFEGGLIPFLPLATALRRKQEDARTERAWSALVIRGTTGLAAVGVDCLRGSSSTVIRPLPELAPAEATIAGVALDAEGTPELVLDPDGLVLEARRTHRLDAAVEQRASSVLVVDDSLTTRMLEQSILESAGYDVDVASSGEQALLKARDNRYSLFLVDVDMPGMDGFTFIERIRSDPTLHDIPAILVTSRSSPEDFERGRQVGANGYMVKSDFNQVELLDRIRRLVA